MLEHVANRRVAVLLLVLAAPAVGLAQQEAEDASNEATAEEPLELAAQTVTGSRLRGGVSASPVYVLTREEIDRRGLQDIEDIVRYIPQNYSTMTSGGSFDYHSPRFAQGLVTVNLRGLGEGSTLVLVNGNRVAASPAEFGTFTDVSTIPFSAIERVEVLTDGASAVYGSDAVGGVVNFILRQDYRGAESTVRYESSDSGGHRRIVEQTLGLTWDTGSLTASANFNEEDGVLAADAGIDIDGDFTQQGGRRFPANYSPTPTAAAIRTVSVQCSSRDPHRPASARRRHQHQRRRHPVYQQRGMGNAKPEITREFRAAPRCWDPAKRLPPATIWRAT